MEDLSYIGNPKGRIRRKKDEYTQVHISAQTSDSGSVHELGASQKSAVEKGTETQQVIVSNIQDKKGETKEQPLGKIPSSGKVLKYIWKASHSEKESKSKTKFVSFSQPILDAKRSSAPVVQRRLAISEFELIKTQKVLIFGGMDPYCTVPAENHGKEVLQYDIYLNHWDRFASMPGSRHHHSAAYCHGRIYVIGGTRPTQRNLKSTLSKSMWSFDTKNLEWTNEKPLPFPRRDFGLVATPKGLHVIGGENCAKNVLSSHLFYDVFNKKWTKKSPLKIARSGLACAVLGWNIWAAGGIIDYQGGGVMTDIVECYDFKKDVWTKIHHLRIPRCFGKLCVLNRSAIYIVGGVTVNENKKFASIASIDKYFFEFREWKEVTAMSNARHGHDLVGIADKIFIFGGVSTEVNTALESVECLWTVNMTWIKGMSPMSTPTSGLAAVVVSE